MQATNGSSHAVRVITVGRSALEPALRAEDGVELVRVRSALEAIGELGAPETQADRTVVLIGDGLEAPGWTRDAAEGVRLVDAGARILAEGPFEPGSVDHRIDAEGSSALDAVLSARLDTHAPPLGANGSNGAHTEPAPATNGHAPARPAPTRAAVLLPEVYQPSDDALPTDDPLIETLTALTQGGEVVPALLRVMRDDPAAAGIVFEPITMAYGPGPKGHVFAEVAHRGAALGRVSGPADRAEVVEAWGQRLTLAHIAAAQHRQLRDAAFSDPLTGAGNRRFFERLLARAMVEARELRREVTILLFDIDDFKHYNDEYGHAAGDEILVEAVRLLRAVTRPTDQVCRIGGDEFVVIFNNEPTGPRMPGSRAPRDVSVIAKRFQRQICDHKFPKLGLDARGGLTISGGLATFPWDGADPESLLDRADALLLESKAAGKNAITLGPGAERVCQGFDGPESPSES